MGLCLAGFQKTSALLMHYLGLGHVALGGCRARRGQWQIKCGYENRWRVSVFWLADLSYMDGLAYNSVGGLCRAVSD
jgi:hypothetical protein